MPLWQACAILSLFCVSLLSEASEIKTTYSISSTSTTVTTAIKGAELKHEELMHDYPFEKLVKTLRTFPMVTSVHYSTEGIEETVSSSASEYHEYKRSYPATIQLNLPTPITMLVQIEESHRKCKSPAEKGTTAPSYSDDGYSSGSDGIACQLSAWVRVKGPYEIYGSFASGLNLANLVREKQHIYFEIRRDYSDKTLVKIDSRFTVESELFDRNLFKFFDALNVKTDTAGEAYSRANFLLGTSRILRVNNERVVGL